MAMQAAGVWDQLSVSSKKALQWAAVMAALRAEHASQTAGLPVNVFDLFAGLLLSHPDDSEAKVLLDHFGLLPGQVLPDGYPQADMKDMQRLAGSIAAGEMPQLDEQAHEVVEISGKPGMNSGSPDVVELRALYAALLQVSNPLSDRLNELISSRGASMSGLSALNREYLARQDSGKNYAELLKEHLPYQPEPARIPRYMADHGQQMNLSHDLVDIRAEVDAFACLLASRGLKPPLAVGLFGDWGSGKSFFMDSVRNRIEQLVSHGELQSKTQAEVPFWKRIIQIEFNAWHYVEGELWASLVDHIFNQLRLAGDREDRVEERKKYWAKQLENRLEKLESIKKTIQSKEKELTGKRQGLDESRKKYGQHLRELERLKNRRMQDVMLKDSLDEARNALEPLMISIGLPSPESVVRQLREARNELIRGRILFQYLQGEDRGRNTVKLMMAIVAVPVTAGVMTMLDMSAVISAFGGLATAAASALAMLGSITRWSRKRLDAIYAAEKKVAGEFDKKWKNWQKEIQTANNNIEKQTKIIEQLSEEEADILREVEQCKAEMENVSAASLLNEFVEQRVGSGDYRKRLGIPALIQQDFRKMSELISAYNVECEKSTATGDAGNEQHYFNRIILYIDDLDRCPDERVVEVLQAVHLLLAFELFVVVVAVDSRWLSHALMKHYPALSMGRWDGNRASSEDYLEKIFQIPFWVRSLGDDARKNIVTGLLRGNLEHTVLTGEKGRQALKLSLGEAEKHVLASLNDRTPPPGMDAQTLTISQDELDFLDTLAPLMGSTPRTVKRFVNLYQLVRIVYRTSGREQDDNGTVPANQRLAFILAIADSVPHLAQKLMARLCKAGHKDTLGTVSRELENNRASLAEEYETYSGWLYSDAQKSFCDIRATDFHEVINTVERFLFQPNGKK